MILPGVPLVPAQRGGEQAVRPGDPLADPERELAAREARMAQPLPVRINTSEVPSPTSAAEPPVTAPEVQSRTMADEPVDGPVLPEVAEPAEVDEVPDTLAAAAPAPAVSAPEPDPAPVSVTRPESTAPTPIAPPARQPSVPQPRRDTRPSWGPWPHPDSAAWPATIPSWGRPPKGFACPSPRVAMVLKDGTHLAPAPEDARAMLGVAASLGA
jgi:hypothetical protein